MRTGNDPPVTVDSPPTPDNVMGWPFASSLTSITAAARSGVYPANQAERFSFVVPVFPAAGLPRACARKPVPFVMTFSRA